MCECVCQCLCKDVVVIEDQKGGGLLYGVFWGCMCMGLCQVVLLCEEGGCVNDGGGCVFYWIVNWQLEFGNGVLGWVWVQYYGIIQVVCCGGGQIQFDVVIVMLVWYWCVVE